MENIIKTIEAVAEEICSHYCKYPEQYDPAEHDGVELFESEICNNCPLTKYM